MFVIVSCVELRDLCSIRAKLRRDAANPPKVFGRQSREGALLMPYVSEEIASQPACWEQAMALARACGPKLPSPGEQVAVVGCGTSYNVARSYACLRERSGQGLTDAMPASEMLFTRTYDRFVFISRSGTTSEILHALGRVPEGTPTTAVTADDSAPLAREARSVVLLDFAYERSIVQTRFATTALTLLREQLGHDTSTLVAEAKGALDAPFPEGALAAEDYTFLGRDWTIGLAHEAALKLRESAQVVTQSYPAMEFRHGPISAVNERSLVWSFGAVPAGLADDVASTGARFEVSARDPMAELIRAQKLAVELAIAAGLDPDRPRNLAFSVVLPA